MNHWKTIVVFFIGIGVGVSSNDIVQQQTAYAATSPAAKSYLYQLIRSDKDSGGIIKSHSQYYTTEIKCMDVVKREQATLDGLTAAVEVDCIRVTPTMSVESKSIRY